MKKRDSLSQEILTLMDDSPAVLSDADFNHFAQNVFYLQYSGSIIYRGYCDRRGIAPSDVSHWLEIPALPTAAFKLTALAVKDVRHAQAVFRTSGTTQGAEQRGAHYVLDLELYRRSLLPTFKRHVMPDHDRMPIVSLVPEWRPGGESSLAFMVTYAMDKLGTPESLNVVTEQGIDYERLHAWLRGHANAVCIVGTSLAFVHWFDHLEHTNEKFDLPHGSRLMDTGGFKGSGRAITSDELRVQYHERLGVPAQNAINEYGMTEMLSQFYDAHLLSAELINVKRGPPWARTAVVDPETLQPLPKGETGLLRHHDLANVFSMSAIQTEDLGREVDGGFELLGRAAGAPPRGCSIAMDMFLTAAKT